MNVLITGGSGFLGRALTKELLKIVDRICIYSRGEYNQYKARIELADPQNKIRWMIGDVRDLARLRWAMQGIDVVIHAAALKRIEVGAYAPSEMVLTNVIGTMNVIDAAAYCGVKKVVGISSDKAWQPVSPYGQSKALAEALLCSASIERVGPKYSVVRYGNVWGSTGSVVTVWRRLIAQGAKRIPVTDPECTRFYMRIEQAVELVLDTVEHMTELVIPTWLPAYRLGDLAEAFGVDMEITGLPEHEKLHEGMNDGLTSDKARRMTVDELREALNE